VKKLHSGMDAWRSIVRSDERRSTVESYLPLILSAAGALGILPFAVIRFMQDEWLAAVIDLVVIVGLLTLGGYVYVTRQVRAASAALAIICIIGVLATVYLIGPQQIYWAFPALVAVFYLVHPRAAIVCALIVIIGVLPTVFPVADSEQTTTILATIIVTSAFAFAFSLITNWQREQLLLLATRDPLTGAGNRRGLDTKLTEIVNLHRRSGTPASIVLLDLDHFKRVNDVHGHAAGDRILKSVTDIINLRIRVTDSLYRIGGEEFVVVLEGADLHHAAHLAEQLRTLVDANELVPSPSVTISLGVAELKRDESPNDWLHRADAALYKAKEAGRNSTSISD
jgi:diguanylate cyclase (GGDEF)-like protein